MSNSANTTAPATLENNGCTPNPTPFPRNTPVAMAYIPFQQYGPLYTPEQALACGTLFPELDKPFLGGVSK